MEMDGEGGGPQRLGFYSLTRMHVWENQGVRNHEELHPHHSKLAFQLQHPFCSGQSQSAMTAMAMAIFITRRYGLTALRVFRHSQAVTHLLGTMGRPFEALLSMAAIKDFLL